MNPRDCSRLRLRRAAAAAVGDRGGRRGFAVVAAALVMRGSATATAADFVLATPTGFLGSDALAGSGAESTIDEVGAGADGSPLAAFLLLFSGSGGWRSVAVAAASRPSSFVIPEINAMDRS